MMICKYGKQTKKLKQEMETGKDGQIQHGKIECLVASYMVSTRGQICHSLGVPPRLELQIIQQYAYDILYGKTREEPGPGDSDKARLGQGRF